LLRKLQQKPSVYTKRVKRIPRKKRVYADGCGVNACLRREYGRAPRGSKPEMSKGEAGLKERTSPTPGATGNITLLNVASIQQTAGFLKGGLQTVCLGKHPKVIR